MINNIDILGYVAMGLSILSFTLQKQRFIRITNLIACLTWVWYGYVINNNPTIIVNILVCLVHVYWFIKRYERIRKLRIK
jgi:positive regulator of sigma E activity